MTKCPICGKAAESRPKNPFGPFCSERCRQIDLGKWLGGEYRIPMEEPTEEDVDEAVRAAREAAEVRKPS